MNYVTFPMNCITLNDLDVCTFAERRYRFNTQFEKNHSITAKSNNNV